MTAFVLSVIPINDIAWPMLYFSNPCKPGPLGFYDPPTCGLMMNAAATVAGIQWTGYDAARLMAKYQQQLGTKVSNFSASPPSGARAGYSMTLTQNGTSDLTGVMTAFSFPNAAATRFMGKNQYYNFAIMSGCKAPAGHLNATARYDCAAILNTFHPRSGWLDAQIQATAQYEMQKAASFVSAISAAVQQRGMDMNAVQNWAQQTMQSDLQTDMGMIENSYQVDDGMIQALGATQTTLVSPSGGTFTTQSDYSVYCMRSDGTYYGTNELGAATASDCTPLQKANP